MTTFQTAASEPSHERFAGASLVSLSLRLAKGPLDVREVLALGAALLTELDELHRTGVTRHALDPTQVLVDSHGPVRSARLRPDIKDPRVPAQRGAPNESIEEVAYGSPEQNGLIADPIDARANLYSAGAILYAALAGHAPVSGANLGEVLRNQLTLPVPQLRSLGIAVPRSLDELLQRVLRLAPDERYQSAAAVLVDLCAIRAEYDRGNPEPLLVIGRNDERRHLSQPAFVGRAAELHRLGAALTDAEEGRSGLVLVDGPSGGGKTRLCDELRLIALARHAWVVSAQTSVGEAQLPLRHFAAVVSALSVELRAGSERAAGLSLRIRAALGDRLPLVCRLFPELQRAFADVPGEERDADHESAPTPQAALDAMVLLVDALGERARPFVLILDDVQWASELTVQWLTAWQRRKRASERPRHVLVVAAFRGDELPVDHPLEVIGAGGLQLSLPPLSGPEIQAMAESMAGPLAALALEPITRLSAGNAFQVGSILEGMVESGALVAEQGWQTVTTALDELMSSSESAAILSRRLDRLASETLAILSTGALLGRRFDPTIAAELMGLEPAAATSLLAEALDRHILWREAGGLVVFAHDRLRAELLSRIPAERQRALHREMALRIEASDPGRVFDLAHHFDAAGDAEKSLEYAIMASSLASRRGDPETAERYLLIADRAAPVTDAPLRARLAEALGDVLMLRGRYAEAAQRLDSARTLVSGPLARARILYKVGDLGYRAGDFGVAVGSLESALRMLGRRVPKRTVTVVASIVFQIIIQFLHSLMPRLFIARRGLERAEEDLLVCAIYGRLTLTAILHQGMLASLRAHLCEVNLAERYPATQALALAYANHGVALGQLPWFGRAIRYGTRAVDIARAQGEPLTLGKALHHLGFVLQWSGRFDDALARQRESLALLRRYGDRWESETCMFGLASTLYRKGELTEAVEVCQELRAIARQDGNALAATYPLEIWAKATGGRVSAEDTSYELERAERHPEIKAAALQAEALRLMGERRWREAHERLAEAAIFVREQGARNDFVAPIPCWQATALRRQLEAAPLLAADQRSALLRRARKAGRRALASARRFRNNLPHAYREQGLLAALEGQPDKARTWLARSLAIATAQGAQNEQTLTASAQRELAAALAWSGTGVDNVGAGAADPEPDRVPTGATPSLVDRFQTVLEVGRSITLALTREAVFEAALDGALMLLRAEGGLVASTMGTEAVDPDDQRRPSRAILLSRGPTQAEHLARLVERALTTGGAVTENTIARTVLVSDAAGDARSALGVPIRLHGVAVAVLYVSSSRLTGLFDGEGTRLAEYIATLAGAALENSEGFSTIRAGEIALRESEQKIRAMTEAGARRHEDERRRLALALHDGLGQVLLAASLQLNELERRLSDDEGKRQLREVNRLLNGVLGDIRGLSHDLFPSLLEDLGLVPALRELAESATTTSLAVSVQAEGEEQLARLSSDASLGLFRIAQAAIANIQQHAHAKHAAIGLSISGDEVTLEVRDDGVGFDLAAPGARSGLGLIGIEQRTLWLNGRCQLASTPGQGSLITVNAPLRPRM